MSVVAPWIERVYASVVTFFRMPLVIGVFVFPAIAFSALPSCVWEPALTVFVSAILVASAGSDR